MITVNTRIDDILTSESEKYPQHNNKFKKNYLLTDLIVDEPVTLSVFSEDFDTYLELIDEETGAVIAYNDDYGNIYENYYTFSSQLNFIPKDTKYLVRVSNYSDYDNDIGNYAFAVEKYEVDLNISSSNIPVVGVLGEEIEVSWTVTNQGKNTITSSDSWYDHIYISDDEYLDKSDILIYQYYQDLFNDRVLDEPDELLYNPLEGGSSQETTELISLNQEKLLPGDRHLLIALDNNHNLRETDETNNILSVPITLIAPEDIDRDLKVTSFTVPDTIYTYNENSEGTVDVSWTVSNLGTDQTTTSFWKDQLYLSQDKYFDNSDVSLDDAAYCNELGCSLEYGKVNTYHRRESLEGKSSYTVNLTLNLGDLPYLREHSGFPVGDAYLLLITDAENKVSETDETNNTFALPITMTDESITVDSKRKNALVESLTIHRFYDPASGGHLYTGDEVEKDYVDKNLNNYTYEGESYLSVAQDLQAEEVYRFFNSQTGVHLYSTSEVEKDSIIENLDNFSYEGVKFYAYETQIDDSVPVYRFYEPSIGVHFYTPNEAEKIFIEENLSNYTYEGIAYYVFTV